jgi:hypothetical protein
MLGVLTVEEEEAQWAGDVRTLWLYSLAPGITPTVLATEQ